MKPWTITFVTEHGFEPTSFRGTHEQADDAADGYRKRGLVIAVHPVGARPRIRTAPIWFERRPTDNAWCRSFNTKLAKANGLLHRAFVCARIERRPKLAQCQLRQAASLWSELATVLRKHHRDRLAARFERQSEWARAGLLDELWNVRKVVYMSPCGRVKIG